MIRLNVILDGPGAGNVSAARDPAVTVLYISLERRQKMSKFKTWSILLIGIVSFVLAGCNTVEGAGEDVEAVGNAVQDAAD